MSGQCIWAVYLLPLPLAASYFCLVRKNMSWYLPIFIIYNNSSHQKIRSSRHLKVVSYLNVKFIWKMFVM